MLHNVMIILKYYAIHVHFAECFPLKYLSIFIYNYIDGTFHTTLLELGIVKRYLPSCMEEIKRKPRPFTGQRSTLSTLSTLDNISTIIDP